MMMEAAPSPPPVALIAVMGLPGCGKTTLCRLLCRGAAVAATAGASTSSSAAAATAAGCIHHLEFDEFVPDSVAATLEEDATGNKLSAWKAARSGLLRSLDRLLCRRLRPDGRAYFDSDGEPLAVDWPEAPADGSRRAWAVLLDDNFYYASMRHAAFQLARFYNCGYGTIYVKASSGQLKLVNALREKPVPNGVIDRMAQRLEAPNPERNPWEKFTYVLNECDVGFLDSVGHYSDCSVNGRLHALINDCLANPFEPIDLEETARQADEARETCSLSLLHQADLRLRAMVSDWLAAKSDQPEAEKAELGRAAAVSKRTLMNALRDGKLKVPAKLNAYSPDKRDELDKFLQDNISLSI